MCEKKVAESVPRCEDPRMHLQLKKSTPYCVGYHASYGKNHKITNSYRMRELTETEMKTLFDKLANYTGRSLTNLISPPSPDSAPSERFVFRLHESRVYYLKLALANLAVSVARENLLSLGTCLGKFTKTGKFRLHITALDIIAPHARYKLWIKPNGEMPFLVGTLEKGLLLFYRHSR